MNIKLIYTDWIRKENITFPLPNGNLKYLNDLAVQRAESLEIEKVTKNLINELLQYDSVKFIQKHDYFYLTWTEFFKNDGLITLEEVDESDNDTTYLYVVELDYCNDNFVDRKLITEDEKEITYNMLAQIPAKIYSLVRQNKVKIVFSCIDNKCFEGHLASLDVRFRMQMIPRENIIFISGNINLDYKGKLKQKSAICAIKDVALIMAGYPERGFLGYESDYVRKTDLDENKFKNKKFLCWNRTLNRSHRYALLYFAQKHNLFDTGYFSFLCSFGNCQDCLDYFYKFPKQEMDKICKEIESALPIQIDTFDLSRQGLQSFRTIDNNKKEIYLDSYVHIISETEFKENRTPYITEKTFRPIMNLQPFIMINNAGSLVKLKELGFKTFHPFIDESYDQEANPQERWNLITKEILKFHSMPMEELHKWYFSILDDLIHNQNKLLEYTKYNILEDCLKELSNGN